MTTLLAFLFVLSVLILVHEFGHFIVAKWTGVRVEKFSLGFGPKLLGFRSGETEYMISAFPLGGYVKMSGENTEDELQGEPWEFASRSILERARIVACGPLMNLLLAMFLMVVVFMLGRKVPEYLSQRPVVGWVEDGSPSQRAGLEVGDRILFVDEQPIETWEQLLLNAADNYGRRVKIQVDRSGLFVACYLESKSSAQGHVEGIGIYPPIPVRVGVLSPGYPAEEAGMRVGDLITAINGEGVSHWFQFAEIIHHSYNQELELTVEREHGPIKIKVTPRKDVLQGGIGLIGIQSTRKMLLRKYGFGQAVVKGLKETHKLLSLTMEFLKKLLLGRASPKTIGGADYDCPDCR